MTKVLPITYLLALMKIEVIWLKNDALRSVTILP